MSGFFVYIHTAPNRKRYVGITHNRPKRRWDCGRGYQRNEHFYAAIQKYGWENFTHQVFEVPSEEAMYRNEQELIELFKSNNPKYGYNNSIGGEPGSLGYKHTDEVKQKMSRALKGRKLTEETKQKISVSNKGKLGTMKGKHHTEEAKQKISAARKDKPGTMKGKHHTDEAKQKISAANKGKSKPKSEEFRRCVSNTLKGKPKPKYKWLTPTGEIVEMSGQSAKRYHPDWELL